MAPLIDIITMLVSIIMPAYNAALYLEDSIKSVLNQTYKHWELLIIDDGSTDETLGIARQYSLKDSRIRVFNQENRGIGAARNVGIRASGGAWIAFLDSDDLWVETKLERQLEVGDKYSDVDVIYTNGSIFFNNDLSSLHLYETISGRFTNKEMYLLELNTNILPVLSILVKRSLINKVGLQDEDYRYGEDWDHWLRMARGGAVFFGLEEKLFYYRRHSNNISANTLEIQMSGVRVLLKNIDLALVSKREALNLIGGKINTLILHLVQINKIAEASAFLRKSRDVFPEISYILAYNLVRVLKNKSFWILKILLNKK